MKKVWIYVLSLGAFGPLFAQAPILTTTDYISQYKAIAESEMQRTGVPASISLAQGIVESNSGNGWLARYSNNHFGIKCKGGWTGETVAYTDDAPDECFRKYDSPVDSWRDHSDFLRSTPRYAFLFQLDPTDYTDWAYGLKRAGYATSPVYARRLIQTIQDYNLEQYTLEAMGQAPLAKDTAVTGPALHFIGDDNDQATPAAVPLTHDYPTGVFTVNGKKVLYLPQGSALLPLAEQYSIKLRDLVSYNDLPDDQPLPRDMLIFLEKKANYGAEPSHIVQPGESMQDISQTEGIQLKWLLKRNKMSTGDEAVPGEKLELTGFATVTPHLMPPPAVQPSPPAPKPSLTRMVGNLKAEIRSVVNHDDTRTPQTPMSATPVLDSSATAQTAYSPPPVTHPGPSRRQWPDTALAAQQTSSDTQVPQASTTVTINKKVNPPRHEWPAAKMTTSDKSHNYSRNGYLYHIVQPGESLNYLSKRFRVPLTELKRWNHLTETGLKSGQHLIIARED